jgi:hypothetical protein
VTAEPLALAADDAEVTVRAGTARRWGARASLFDFVPPRASPLAWPARGARWFGDYGSFD